MNSYEYAYMKLRTDFETLKNDIHLLDNSFYIEALVNALKAIETIFFDKIDIEAIKYRLISADLERIRQIANTELDPDKLKKADMEDFYSGY